jgi:succinyl-diaminopimelate desuccinylase
VYEKIVKIMYDLDFELNVLKKIVAVNSDSITKSGYKECASIVADEAEKIGLKVEVFDSKLKSPDKLPRPSVVATLNVGAPKTLLVAAHYDIVPPGAGWDYDPFNMKVDEDKAYGRGTADDKGSIAVLLGAARKVGRKSRVNLKILVTPDEEVGGELGLGYLIDEVGIRGDEAIIVDANSDFLSIGASGVVNGTITVKGIQGHAGYPHKFLNALEGISKLIVELKEFQDFREHKLSRMDAPPGSPKKKVWGRFSVTMLRSGVKSNIIPGEAEATFDMRLLPEEDTVKAQSELKKFLEKADLGDPRYVIDLKFDQTGGNYYADPKLPFVQDFKNTVKTVTGVSLPLAAELGGNDGKFTSGKGIPTISYGPLADDTHFHGVNEFVWLKDLKKVRDVIAKYLEIK